MAGSMAAGRQAGMVGLGRVAERLHPDTYIQGTQRGIHTPRRTQIYTQAYRHTGTHEHEYSYMGWGQESELFESDI